MAFPMFSRSPLTEVDLLLQFLVFQPRLSKASATSQCLGPTISQVCFGTLAMFAHEVATLKNGSFVAWSPGWDPCSKATLISDTPSPLSRPWSHPPGFLQRVLLGAQGSLSCQYCESVLTFQWSWLQNMSKQHGGRAVLSFGSNGLLVSSSFFLV